MDFLGLLGESIYYYTWFRFIMSIISVFIIFAVVAFLQIKYSDNNKE